VAWYEEVAGAEVQEAAGVVGLIMSHGHEELGNAGGEALAEGADAAVVNEGGGLFEQGAEGGVFGGVNGWGQVGGQLSEIAGDEDAGALDLFEGSLRGGEERGGLDVGAAGREDDGRGAGVGIEESGEGGRKRLFGGEVFQGEVGLEARMRPVGLGWGEPFREEQEAAIGGIPPLPEETFRRANAVGVAELAECAAGEEVERVGAVVEEKSLHGRGQQAQDAMEGREDNGGVVGAEENSGLEVDGDEGDGEGFAGETGAEGGDGGEQEVGLAGALVVRGEGGEIEGGGVAGVFENGPGAGAHLPEAGVAHEELEVFIAADGNEGDGGFFDGLAEQAGGDEGDVVTAGAEVAGEPEEGQHVTGGTEGQEGDFQKGAAVLILKAADRGQVGRQFMGSSFEGAEEALAWLYNTQRLGVKLGLENMRRLLDDLALPDARARVIHVAGTNGKGSTCAFIHTLLSGGAGYRAGLFTSPHLVSFNERIRDEEREITGEELAEMLGGLRERVASWDPHPTFFELTLALALEWFRRREVAWVVLETGLGGRLDATNAVQPAVSVITCIGMDHMEMLGDTVEKIAEEKAGIIKKGVPVVTAPQRPEVMAVLRRVAGERGARLVEVAQPWTASEVGLAGEHQRWNAALAVAAVREAGVILEPGQVERALAATRWPGRFERVGPDWVLDGAHNEDGIGVLVKTWVEVFGARQATVIFGAVEEKALQSMLRRLAPIVKRWCLTGFRSPRARAPEDVRLSLEALELAAPGAVSCHESVEAAIGAARREGGPVLVCGSLFLIGEARALLVRGEGRFEKSWQ
jgi:dihydrofolate synthase/folylpolyglutamate synthase